MDNLKSTGSPIVLVLCGLLVGLSASSALAAGTYPISGNVRYQKGNDLPTPLTFTPAPNGRVANVSGAVVHQTAGPDPKQMTIPPGQLTTPGNQINLGVFFANSAVFELQSARSISFPKQQAVLKAGGRTGAAIVSFCPGQTVDPTGNPGCAGPSYGPLKNGRLRYVKTANQFGGPALAAVGGSAKVFLRAGAPAPCTDAVGGGCLVITANDTQAPAGVLGGAFGVVASTPGPAPSPGLYYASVTPNGIVFNRTAIGIGPGLPNPKTSYAGPWTTGMVTASISTGPYAAVFTLTGADNRVGGVGSISLVSGGLSYSQLSGSEPSRGWLNLTTSPALPGLPVLTGWGIGLLTVTIGGVALRRTRKAASRGD